jgi:hypothetical protein
LSKKAIWFKKFFCDVLVMQLAHHFAVYMEESVIDDNCLAFLPEAYIIEMGARGAHWLGRSKGLTSRTQRRYNKGGRSGDGRLAVMGDNEGGRRPTSGVRFEKSPLRTQRRQRRHWAKCEVKHLPNDDDQQLLDLASRGDAAAFETLMRAHEGRMYAVALRIGSLTVTFRVASVLSPESPSVAGVF